MMGGRHSKKKKIYYVPGMISLLFIPLMCLFYFFYTGAFVEHRAIDIGMPDKGDFFKYKVSSLRKYKEFNFDKKNDAIHLKELKNYLLKLIKESDTINGAKVHFGTKSTYEDFIDVVDVLVVDNLPTWILHEDDFYILGASNKPKKVKGEKKLYRINCGTGENMEKMHLRELELKKEQENRQFKISFLKEQWILFVAYFGIVLLNIFALVKFNKNI